MSDQPTLFDVAPGVRPCFECGRTVPGDCQWSYMNCWSAGDPKAITTGLYAEQMLSGAASERSEPAEPAVKNPDHEREPMKKQTEAHV